jgi:UDP-N-acetyl-D-galactosamine dehydrogenase
LGYKLLNSKILIGVIGQGYVGLPLSIEFGKKLNVIGFDIDSKRINELNQKKDRNIDIKLKEFNLSKKISFTDNISKLHNCNVYIITVPTPITKKKIPNLKYIKQACNDISKVLKKGDIVILESTVYPGVSEDICVPILQKKSKLIFNKDFFFGYSPERINPNDNKYKINNIVKVTSGSNLKTLNFIDKLYNQLIKAVTFRVRSIKIAEAAKVIENAQRDINIAFINELCLIFDKLNINTNEVLKAASTKWNFINFKPGIVGGHCIGVDPYYLTHKSIKSGYVPKIITAGREINDNFTTFITNKAIRNCQKKFKLKKFKFLILGLTFKENCVDYRNSKSIELANLLIKKKYVTHCYDPLLKIDEFNSKNKIQIIKKPRKNYYHCVIVSVAHNYFINLGEKKIKTFLLNNGFIFDIKNIYPDNSKNLYL